MFVCLFVIEKETTDRAAASVRMYLRNGVQMSQSRELGLLSSRSNASATPGIIMLSFFSIFPSLSVQGGGDPGFLLRVKEY